MSRVLSPCVAAAPPAPDADSMAGPDRRGRVWLRRVSDVSKSCYKYERYLLKLSQTSHTIQIRSSLDASGGVRLPRRGVPRGREGADWTDHNISLRTPSVGRGVGFSAPVRRMTWRLALGRRHQPTQFETVASKVQSLDPLAHILRISLQPLSEANDALATRDRQPKKAMSESPKQPHTSRSNPVLIVTRSMCGLPFQRFDRVRFRPHRRQVARWFTKASS